MRPVARPASSRPWPGSRGCVKVRASWAGSSLRSFPQFLSGVVHQLQAQVSELCQVILAQAVGELVLVLHAFLPDRLDLGASGFGQARPHGAAILRVGHALDQPIALEVVDEAGDVTGGGIEVGGEVAQRGGPASE